ncbi:MAG: nucleotidyltransferase domain-containing protein [Bradymonadaceae bacterium]|nr:nucleotidyltransferase domain-containing protein [Lujinxingiaceae bacterium]
MHDDLLKSFLAQQRFPLMFATLNGAHLYGFPSDDSDYDLRGAHILPLESVVGMYPEDETLETTTFDSGIEIDLVTHDIKKYFTLLLKRNGYVLEQIFSPLIYHTSPAFEELREIAVDCITRNHAYHYRNFAQKQWDLFEKQRRLKPLLYCYRALLTGIHLMESAKIEANLMRLNHGFRLPYLGDLISLKLQGSETTLLEDVNLNFHEKEYRRLSRQLEDARMSSSLPDEPRDKLALHNLLIRLRLETR